MDTQFCVMAWPDGGHAEMMVEACNTREAAEFLAEQKRRAHPRWRFRVAEHAPA
jgi:hypothetical protein